MKIVAYIFLSLLLILIIGYCAVMAGLRKTTWGGWRPEEPEEFTLTAKELQWQKATEEKYAVTCYDISLDPAMIEDTVVYVKMLVNDTSALQRQSCDETTSAMAIARSYWNVIKTERLQTCIQLSFADLLYDCDGKRSQFTKKRTYLFDGKRDTILWQSDY